MRSRHNFFPWKNRNSLGGGFKYFLFSPLFGEDFQFDEYIFQMGWFNHHQVPDFMGKFPSLLLRGGPRSSRWLYGSRSATHLAGETWRIGVFFFWAREIIFQKKREDMGRWWVQWNFIILKQPVISRNVTRVLFAVALLPVLRRFWRSDWRYDRSCREVAMDEISSSEYLYFQIYSPWKTVVGRQAFPIGKVTFQGRAVKLPRCTTKQSRKQNKKKVPAWRRKF